MARFYVDGDRVRFTESEGEWGLVDAQFYNGESFSKLQPRRLFPVSGLMKYIALIDKDNNEAAIVRDINSLMPESARVIKKCLDEYYMIPKITKVLERHEKFGILKFTVLSDKGERSFEIKNRHSDIKILYDGRVLIRDSNDNRYEIEDVGKLDKQSYRLITTDI